MARRINRLTARTVQTIDKIGRHGDGNGLYLNVSANGGRRWVFLYRLAGRVSENGKPKLFEMGLGSASKVSLKGLAKPPRSCGSNFAKASIRCTSGELQPKHFQNVPVTASRIRGRIEAVLDWAAAHKYRSTENPARWRGHLDKVLPAMRKVAEIEHHPALLYADISAFMTDLRNRDGAAAKALEFTILTAARTGEIGAKWSEIDVKDKVWTVPADRMKASTEHQVPLSDRAIENLTDLDQETDYVFPGQTINKSLSDMAMLALLKRVKRSDLTVHGFRSTFRDWAAETTEYPNELVEMALAHTIRNKAEAAYRRGNLLERRRALMQSWADYCKR